MTLPAIPFVQTNFSGGQITAQAKRQDDVRLVRAACRVMRNARPSPTGSAVQRLGRRALFSDSARTETVRFLDGSKLRLTFGQNRVTVRSMDGEILDTVEGLPWDVDGLANIRYAVFNRHVFITYPDTQPVDLAIAVDGTTTKEDFAFGITSTGALRQPYYRYATPGVTLTPSGLSGDIDLVFSDDVLEAGHVGVRVRYVGREIEITEVTDATHAAGTVIDTLPPTYTVTLDNVLGFVAGQVAIGVDTGAQGEVIAVDDNAKTITVVMSKAFGGFIADEYVASPTGRGKVSSTSSTTAGGSVQWDEALMSDLRGWPRFVGIDQQRLIFADFPNLLNGIAYSAIQSPNDFLPGADANEAIFELAPNGARVLSVLGGADEFLFTDVGIFYVPISTGNPLIPGGIEFRLVSSIGASAIVPVLAGSGAIYINGDATRVCYIYSTGLTTRPYDVKDVSELHGELFASPRCIAATTGAGSAAERYVYIVNGDGSLILGRFNSQMQAADEWVGWVPTTFAAGVLRWVSAFGEEVCCNVIYTAGAFGPDELSIVEILDEDAYLDGQVALNDPPASLIPLQQIPDFGPLWIYATGEVDVMRGRRYLGRRSVDAVGNIIPEEGDDFSAIDVVAGQAWTSEIEPFIPNLREEKAVGQRGRRRKIKRAQVSVIGSTGFSFMGRRIGNYEPQEDQAQEPELREQTYTFRGLGRAFDPRPTFVKDVPGPFEVLEISGEVTV